MRNMRKYFLAAAALAFALLSAGSARAQGISCSVNPISGTLDVPPSYTGMGASATPTNEADRTKGWTVNLSGHSAKANVNTYCKMIAN